MKYLISRAASEKSWGNLILDFSVAFMHARTDEEIDIKTNGDIKVASIWAVKGCNQQNT